ncbi:MAG: cell division protein ZipA C-terminal FtsZ-binding domain-containing protein [Halioglobus sp.]
MLNVVARSPQGFRGDDILQILLACDLRFGDMNFFHRHEFEAGRGAIQFSVANMMQPRFLISTTCRICPRRAWFFPRCRGLRT